MQNTNRKVFDKLVSKTKIYLVIIAIILIILCFQNTKLILPAIIGYLLIMLYTFWTNSKGKDQITETLQDLSLTMDSAAKSSLINSPFPLIILGLDGNIIWKSSRFSSEFANVDINVNLEQILNEMKIQKEKNEKELVSKIEISDKEYRVVGKYSKQKSRDKKKKTEEIFILYFIDETENVRLQEEYEDSKSCVTMILIDNFDETMQSLENEKRAQVTAEIDKIIYEWTDMTNGVLIKSDRDKYIYLFEKRYLERIKKDKFSILDKIKEINTNISTQITLSIAVSNEGVTDKEKYKSCEIAMEMILGRGGDQAVIRENENYKFFGGRAQEVEKRTKVKARVVAHTLESMIKNANKVMIMGHRNPDMDSVGASMGIYRLGISLNINTYIIDSEKKDSIKQFDKQIMEEEEYKNIFINKEVALENIDEDTVLIIVDTHKTNFVEFPDLLEKTKQIVIIDHHRRSTDYIENAELVFQEVYASSASELVTEILQHSEVKIELKTLEVESLYAGIMMDTKNFTFKTGVRTFEAAAYLRKCGVDIIRVKKWFQSDLKSFNKIADIVKSAELINGTIAISINEEKDKDANLMCAKASDELLTISDITASFVLGYMNEKICISARSIGDINVQLILEKLRWRSVILH